MKNALTLHRLDQDHRTEPKTYTRLKAMATDLLEDQHQEALVLRKVAVNVRAMEVVLPTKCDGKEEIPDSGHLKARGQEALNVHSSTMTEKEERGQRR